MKTYAIDPKTYEITGPYIARYAAQSSLGNSCMVVQSADDFNDYKLSMSQAVEIYNHHTPAENAIKKFTDRPTANKRLWALAEARALAPKEPSTPQEKIVSEEKVVEKAAGARGRKTVFEGHIIKSTKAENPRREGTNGHKSMAIILAFGDKGVSYADFIAAGGRRVDLAWDLDKGNVTVSKS
jgi:hypothetical protein